MRVEYENTPADLRVLGRMVPLKWRFAVLRYVVIAALPGTLLLAAIGDWQALAICGAAQVAVFAFFFFSMRRKVRLCNRPAMTPLVLSIDEQSIEVARESLVGRADWSLISKIRESRDCLLLFVSEVHAHIVPRRAFSSESQVAEFASLARRYFDHSRGSSYVPFTPPEPAEVVASQPDEPASVVQVRYQNTGEELALVQFIGLARSQPAWKRAGTWVWLAAVLAIVIAVLCLRTRVTEFGPMFFSLMAFLLLELAAMVVYMMVMVWLTARRAAAHLLTPRVLTITPQGAWLYAARSEYRCSWAAIDEIGENERFVVLFFGRPHFLSVIPKTAFGSRLECEQFVQLARQWKARAAHEASPANAPSRVETGNPYQSPTEG